MHWRWVNPALPLSEWCSDNEPGLGISVTAVCGNIQEWKVYLKKQIDSFVVYSPLVIVCLCSDKWSWAEVEAVAELSGALSPAFPVSSNWQGHTW